MAAWRARGGARSRGRTRRDWGTAGQSEGGKAGAERGESSAAVVTVAADSAGARGEVIVAAQRAGSAASAAAFAAAAVDGEEERGVSCSAAVVAEQAAAAVADGDGWDSLDLELREHYSMSHLLDDA